jgi:hypothetical protein
MPPRQKKQSLIDLSEAIPICKGAGMTAGLEIHRLNGIFFLVDVTEEKRFAADVSAWTAIAAVESTTRAKAIVSSATATTSTAIAATTGLNTSPTKKIRDAKK